MVRLKLSVNCKGFLALCALLFITQMSCSRLAMGVLTGPMTPFRSTKFLISFLKFSCSFKGRSLSSAGRQEQKPSIEPEVLMTKDIARTDSWDHTERERDMRQGFDLATTLERIEKNFVISDPRLPDNPIVR
jgi:hypothetical protein